MLFTKPANQFRLVDQIGVQDFKDQTYLVCQVFRCALSTTSRTSRAHLAALSQRFFLLPPSQLLGCLFPGQKGRKKKFGQIFGLSFFSNLGLFVLFFYRQKMYSIRSTKITQKVRKLFSVTFVLEKKFIKNFCE